MNRGQLVEFVAKKQNLSKKEADSMLATIIEGIQTGVKKDGTVQIASFGSFNKVTRAARLGRNPSTGASLKIPKKTIVKFSTSKLWSPTKKVAKANVVTAKAAKKVTAKKVTAKKVTAKKVTAKKVIKKISKR